MDSGVTIERLRAAAHALKTGDDRSALKAIQAAQDALDAAKADRLAALESSKDFELDGASSVTTWARNELRLDVTETKKLVRAAHAARDLPLVAAAAAEGRIRLDHLAAFAYGLKHIGHRIVRESEDWLLDVATTNEPAQLRRVMKSLREAVYPDELDEAWAKGMNRQDLQVTAVPDGWHVAGFLNTVTGAKFKTVLDTLGAPRDADDTRPGSERRVDALGEMLDSILEGGLPSDQGVRPQLSILVDANGPSARLAGFGAIGPKLLDYLTCLSDLTLITTTGGDLEQARILNLGRTHRHANRHQRRAIIARQAGVCAAPGCANTHLEIHHTTWWSRGGRTDLDQLIGLCVRCHHLIHRQHLNVTADGHGHFDFTTGSGRPLDRKTQHTYLPPKTTRSMAPRAPLRT